MKAAEIRPLPPVRIQKKQKTLSTVLFAAGVLILLLGVFCFLIGDLQLPAFASINSRLKSESGDVRLMVDPQAAPHVAKDLEGVALLKGGSGEIDKKAAPELTHISDALGYYIAAEFPVQGRPKTAIHHISASRTIYYG